MKRFLLCSAFLFLFTNCALAVRVSTLYQGTVPVASQSAEERDKALPKAFEETLLKISGNNSVLENPKLKLNLDKLNTLVQEFSYASSTYSAKPYLLIAQFDKEAVNQLLQSAAEPIWGQNRPLVLVLIDSEIKHPAEIIDNSSENIIKTILKQRAEQRGVPIIFPMMDMADLNQIDINDVAAMNLSHLQAAAKRYANDAMLMVRLSQTQNGFIAEAKLQLGQDSWSWTVKGAEEVPVLVETINNTANTLAKRFATIVASSVQTTLNLKIVNVTGQNDFTQMMRYVAHLPPVANAEVTQLTGSDVLLNVSLRGSRESLIQILSGGGKLTALPDQPDSGTLVYQWNP